MRIKLIYDIKQRKRASTLLTLASTEIEAAKLLIDSKLFRETVIHLYFGAFYISQAFLCEHISLRPSHKAVDTQLHRVYGRSKVFPKRYLKLHSVLHKLRTEISYKSPHSPEPSKIIKHSKSLREYYNLAKRSIAKISYDDILRDILNDNPNIIKDFSLDIYCPITYRHHTRITIWFPPFYLDVFKCEKLTKHAKGFLKKLRVKKHDDYVAGLNSKLDQYNNNHLLMFDIDSFDVEVETTLKNYGGILLKSGRGFHFIGNHVIQGYKEWVRALKKVIRHPVLKDRVDKDHILISLQRGYSTLRITKSSLKQEPPQFFKEFK